MSNEEILEEIYVLVHKFGVFNEFMTEVNNLLQNKKYKLYDAVNETYNDFISKGIIVDIPTI